VQLRVDLVRVVDGGVVERILGAGVDPDGRPVARRVSDQVVAGEVRGVVEGPGGRVGAAEPKGGRVSADGAEISLAPSRRAPYPPIEMPPIATRLCSGIASSSTIEPQSPSARLCQ
jgi:hypothetical protein